MEREKYLKALLFMSKIEDEWYRDENDMFVFYHPEKMSPEALEAARILNENEKSLEEDECEIREYTIYF